MTSPFSEALYMYTHNKIPQNPFLCFRMHGSPDLTYGDFIIVQSVWGMTQGMAFPLHGLVVKVGICFFGGKFKLTVVVYLEQYIGHRCAMFGGCLVFSLGAALTYFTLDAGLPAVAFTYGFVSAFGQGIALIPTMVGRSCHLTETLEEFCIKVIDVTEDHNGCFQMSLCTLWGVHSVVIFCRIIFDMFHRPMG